MKILAVLLTVFSFSLFANGGARLSATYIYSTNVEGQESKTTWTIEKKEDIWQFHGESVDGKTLVIASPSQINTQSFSHHSKTTSNFYSVRREGDTLIAKSENNGEKLEKPLPLNGDTWVQEFDFSLKPYIISESSDFKFSIVHPKKLSLHNMVATKQGLDQIDINGKVFTALKVKVTLRGFKKIFWHADLWFDQESADLLKYKANDGPNTPTSIMTLFSKQID